MKGSPASTGGRHFSWLAAAVLMIGLSASVLSWQYVRRGVDQHERARFEADSRRIHLLIRDRLSLYLEMLDSARGLFLASQSVDRSEWRQFIRFEGLKDRYEAVAHIGYLQRVPPEERERFEAAVRSDSSIHAQGYPDFRISSAPGETDAFPVLFCEPDDICGGRLGFDMAEDPARMRAMDFARDSGGPAVTAPTVLRADNSGDPAFLIFMPIYRNGAPVGSVEERRQALLGFVYSAIQAPKFLDSVLSGELLPSAFDVEIMDQGEPGSPTDPKRPLADLDRTAWESFDPAQVRHRSVQRLKVADRVWEIHYFGLKDYRPIPVEAKLPSLFLAGGLLLSALLSAMVWSLTNSRRFAEHMARSMNKELIESREQLSDIIRQAKDPIVTLDLLGFVREVNPAAETLSGFSRNDMVGKHFTKIGVLTARSLPVALKEFAFVVAGTVRPPYELDMARKNGEPLSVELNSTLIRRNGLPYSIHVIVRDITERKRLDEQMRQLSIAVEQSPVSIVITDLDGHILYANKKFEAVSGYTFEEVRGQNPRILKSGDMPPQGYKQMWETILAGREWRGRFHNRRKDGSLYWEAATIVPVRQSDGTVVQFLAIKEDITEKLSLEAQLAQAQKMETVGTLAGGIAHDLNNSLTPILGYLDLLLVGRSPEDPGYRYLTEAKKAAGRCADTISGLLRFSRPTTHEKHVVSTGRLLGEFQILLRTALPKNITRQLKCAADIWPIHVNETDIHAVLMNLAANARDAIGEKDGLFELEAANLTLAEGQSGAARAGEYVRISIRDTGCGIDEAHLPRIFEPFFTTKPRGKGTGLGLSMAFTILKAHDGWITAQSRPGQGSTFEIFLPRALEPIAVTPERELASEPQKGKGTVLVIDDEEDVRSLTMAALAELGYTAVPARSGEEAVRILTQQRSSIGCVLLDMVMPGLSGKQTLLKLLEKDPKARVILVSGYTDEGSQPELLALGAKAFLQKPFLIRTLADTLKRVLDAG